ncbi:MAG: hypothetical protein BVN35_20010 [Proteobacteria bacterium ST_bin11]|nr:MAG: hypothetical protein BVN35_20010 [Proteobacteria bacterium ST_bin11]
MALSLELTDYLKDAFHSDGSTQLEVLMNNVDVFPIEDQRFVFNLSALDHIFKCVSFSMFKRYAELIGIDFPNRGHIMLAFRFGNFQFIEDAFASGIYTRKEHSPLFFPLDITDTDQFFRLFCHPNDTNNSSIFAMCSHLIRLPGRYSELRRLLLFYLELSSKSGSPCRQDENVFYMFSGCLKHVDQRHVAIFLEVFPVVSHGLILYEMSQSKDPRCYEYALSQVSKSLCPDAATSMQSLTVMFRYRQLGDCRKFFKAWCKFNDTEPKYFNHILVLLALTSKRQIAVERKGLNKQANLVNLFLSDDERLKIRRLVHFDQPARYFMFWARKAKRLGQLRCGDLTTKRLIVES